MTETGPLYHYTCDHGAKGIGTQGELRPNPISIIGVALVWLTDLDVQCFDAEVADE